MGGEELWRVGSYGVPISCVVLARIWSREKLLHSQLCIVILLSHSHCPLEISLQSGIPHSTSHPWVLCSCNFQNGWFQGLLFRVTLGAHLPIQNVLKLVFSVRMLQMQTESAYRFSAFQKQDIFHRLFSMNPFCSIYTKPRKWLLRPVWKPVFVLSFKAASHGSTGTGRDTRIVSNEHS